MRQLILSLLLGGLASPGWCLESEPSSGLHAVASRLFLAPGAPPSDTDAPERLVPTMIDRIANIVQSDPVLGPQRVMFTIARREEWGGYRGDPDRVPEALRVEGVDVEAMSSGPDPHLFSFRPSGAASDWAMDCMGPLAATGALSLCTVSTTYPPDPKVTLTVSFEPPPPVAELVPRLSAVARRIREIASCLDMTEAPPDDPEAAFAALLAANPTLTTCGVLLLS